VRERGRVRLCAAAVHDDLTAISAHRTASLSVSGARRYPGLRLLLFFAAVGEECAPGHVDLIKRLFFGGIPRELLDPLSTALECVYANLLAQGSLPPPGNL
jgi:hypothetical protein